ncbi:DUF3841 domain-containing protein [Bacillus massilioanorexius]|uniref:DUF3841 domain-containing protein n=2 Tax=Bacillus TaxID=1386 RepID=UPI001FE3A353|nr:DUF3841 domain-containing protein [Bacillus massilioanorexius]
MVSAQESKLKETIFNIVKQRFYKTCEILVIIRIENTFSGSLHDFLRSTYKTMRKQGYLEGLPEYAMFPEQYIWMMKQMKKRRPNRNESQLLAKGTPGVILKLDIPEENVLLSCFSTWHAILNNSPITDSLKEWKEFKEAGFPEDKVRKTWERVFDFDWINSCNEDNWLRKVDWIQGVVPRISMDQVVKVERFIAKERGI